jgi:prophage regulatory protein
LTKSDRLLRRSEVEARTGLRKTAIYGRIKAKSFPAAVELSPGVMRWSESSIEAWVAAQGRAL